MWGCSVSPPAFPPHQIAPAEAELAGLRATTSSQVLGSVVDTRRRTIAQRLYATDPSHPVALQELALTAYWDLDWKLNRVRRLYGRPNPRNQRGLDGRVWRARRAALDWAEQGLAADPQAWWPHEARARVHGLLGDFGGVRQAGEAARAAHPDSARALLWIGLGDHRTDRPERAQAAFEAALALLPPEERTVYTDPRSILTTTERDAWPADDPDAAARYWHAADPRRLTPASERWLEHVARIAYADLIYFDPYDRGPGHETARGEIHVRYGPARREVWSLSQDGMFHRWTYDGFSLAFRDLSVWGDLVHDDGFVVRQLEAKLGSTYQLEPRGGWFEPPIAVGRLREPDGSTALAVALGVPMRPEVGSDRSFDLKTGLFVVDESGGAITAHRDDLSGQATGLRATSRGRLWTAGSVVPHPGTGAALVAEIEQTSARTFGSIEIPLAEPLPVNGLVLSDPILGSTAQDRDGRSFADGPLLLRRGIAFRPVALAEFATTDPIYVYWEGYGLLGTDTRVEYELTTTLRAVPAGGLRGAIGRILGGAGPPTVSVAIEGAAPPDEVGDFVIVDASGQAPGEYVLTLTLRDRISGATTSSAVALTLTDGAR
ncbi:MAG: GWxTD domain-containing protein [Bacteroidota bacterium]